MMQQVYRGEIAPPGRAFTYAELAGAWTRVNEPGAFIPAFEAWSRDTFGRVIGGGEVNATTMKQDKEYVSITGTEEVSPTSPLFHLASNLSENPSPHMEKKLLRKHNPCVCFS